MSQVLRKCGAAGLGLLMAGAAGCASKQNAKVAPDVKPAAAAEAAPTRVGGVSDFEPKAKEPVVETLPSDVQEINRKGYLKDSFFDFDRYDVRTDQRDALTADARWLRKWSTVKIRVEGHCDERGTSQYNLALGEKRAEADREYLESLGVDPARIETVSMGKEHPFARGHDEQAWAENRRDHFVVIAR